jgi:hypothetical protein
LFQIKITLLDNIIAFLRTSVYRKPHESGRQREKLGRPRRERKEEKGKID